MKNYRVYYFILIILLFHNIIIGQSEQLIENNLPKTFVLNGEVLSKNKQIIDKNTDATKSAALKSLLAKADKIVKVGKLYSVMNKKQLPPSGNKHDYMSQAPYWWADSTKANGLPYIRRDGERNPELKKLTDHEEMGKLINDTEIVALAYYFSKNEDYSAYVSLLLKTWFLNDSTRQTPHLNFGQGIPGINSGRGIGIIETRELYRIIDAVTLINGSKNWSKQNHTALKKWFSDYLTWLIESPIGKDEADEHNNHGTHYDVQVIGYALFTEQIPLARQQIEITKQRMSSQLKHDGSQPFELARTLSWDYANMNLMGFFTIARMAEIVNIDLWKYRTSDDKNLQKCVDWMIPYLKKEKNWDYKQIKSMEYDNTVKILRISAVKYASPIYDSLAKTLDSKQYLADFDQLTF